LENNKDQLQVVETDVVQVGRRLKEAREFLGLSQEVVANHLGVPRPAISAIEGGKRNVTVLELKQFSQLYRRSYDYFLEDDPGEADETVFALFKTAKDLNDVDREQVLRFAEFLKHAGPVPRPKHE